MDAFFASVEQRDNPDLQGKPVAVGGSSHRGVVASASYEARKYGVHSAMPGMQARRKCPDLLFVRGDFEKYKMVSRQIRTIFLSYTTLVEPLSLDEAYLDVTQNTDSMAAAAQIARKIREQIEKQTCLTASAGVSYNKFLAKVASDVNKPNGLKVILPEEGASFLRDLPISRFHGIGAVTAEKCRRMGIYKGADLLEWPQAELQKVFGKAGGFYYRIVRGIDSRPVDPTQNRKSIGAERTFSEDCSDAMMLQQMLETLCRKIFTYMQREDNYGKTLTVKVKTADFRQISRSRTFASDLEDFSLFHEAAEKLLHELLESEFSIRLLGVSMSHLQKDGIREGVQLALDL